MKDLKKRWKELGAPQYGDRALLWSRLSKAEAQKLYLVKGNGEVRRRVSLGGAQLAKRLVDASASIHTAFHSIGDSQASNDLMRKMPSAGEFFMFSRNFAAQYGLRSAWTMLASDASKQGPHQFMFVLDDSGSIITYGAEFDLEGRRSDRKARETPSTTPRFRAGRNIITALGRVPQTRMI